MAVGGRPRHDLVSNEGDTPVDSIDGGAMTGPLPAVHVRDGQGDLFEFNGTSRRMKVSGSETEGHLTAFVSTYPDDVPHPLHVHHDSIETFFLLDGAARFFVGDDVIEAQKGDFVSVPRGAVHGFVPTAPGTSALVLFTPAAMEGFWEEIAQATSDGSIDGQFVADLSARYNLESIGPLPSDER